ncbi:MAG: DUF58 domain-containing protein [Gemmataceae bacterium]|nr:DUF58 domain-containing protein [Gemmataceae bacterium]
MGETRNDPRPWLNRMGCWLRAVATYDAFPAFSAKVRRLLYKPLGILLLAALVALLCGLFLHAQGFVLCGGVLTVLVLGLLWPWLGLRGLQGSIAFDRLRIREGEAVEVCLTLRNRLPWAAWGLAVRGGFSGSRTDPAEAPPAVSIAAAPRRRTIRCRWSFVPDRRGVFPLQGPRLTTGFPFGLWENHRLLTVAAPLLVWPRTFPVGPVPLVHGDQQVEGNVSRNKVGSNGDVLGVRPYRRGDSPRRIHWGQSARHDRLIICELQANARPVIQLILDTDPQVHAGEGRDSSREWAIRIVASLARGWLQAGAQVGAVWNREPIPAAAGPHQVNRLLDRLAQLPDTAGPTLAETLGSPACWGFTGGLQVIVTTDRGLVRVCRPRPEEDQQRWVVLRTEAFTGSGREQSAAPGRLPVRPWLWMDGPEQIPLLLRGGWKEAQHGS